MPTVHFWGIENVVEAFTNKELPYFAIISGKKIIHKNQDIEDINEAAENLRSFLNMLNTASGDLYTINIYESVPAAGIKSNTPEDYGLNFKLNELPLPASKYFEAQAQTKIERQSKWDELFSRISAIEQKLQEEDLEEEEEEEEDSSIGGVLNTMLKKPEIQGAILNFVGNMFAQPVKKPGALAGVDTQPGSLEESLAILRKYDTRLEEDLKLLADMAVNNTAQFNFLLTMLRK